MQQLQLLKWTGTVEKDYTPQSSIRFDKKIKEAKARYSYPKPTITVEEAIEASKHLKALPFPPHIVDTTKQRTLILNLDFNSTNLDTNVISQLAENRYLYYSIELVINKHINTIDIAKINREIAKIKKSLPKTQIWLKIPHPDPYINNNNLTGLTHPDALVLGHGIPTVYESIEQYNPKSPTLESGAHLYNHSLASLLSLPKIKVPIIFSGGVHTSTQIADLIHNRNVSGIQITTHILKDWMHIVNVNNHIKKLL